MESRAHRGTKPLQVTLGESETDFYTVILHRDEENNLYIKVTRSRPSGDTTLLNANVYDIQTEVETISDVELRVNCGNVSEQDKVAINFITRLTKMENPDLYDFLKRGVELGAEEKEFALNRKYTKEDVLLALLNKQVKEKLGIP